MSHRRFSDVIGGRFECEGNALHHGDNKPSVCVCETCGLPLEEGDHTRCKNPVKLVSSGEHSGEERRSIVAAKMEQSTACQEAAYAEFMRRMEGTPEYYQALEGFILLLFPDCNPPTTVLPEVHKPEVEAPMNPQTVSPTAKPGSRCPLCGKPALVRSPSGLNLLCHACNRIAVLPHLYRRDGHPDAAAPGQRGGRHKKP